MNAERKKSLRTHFRAVRASMTEQAYAEASAAIAARLLAQPAVASAHTIHAFWPSLARREVDLRPLLHTLHARGVAVVLPRVDPATPRRLRHHLWDGHPLPQGAWGLEEPAGGPEVPLAQLDIVLIPALAADQHGVRLGYGKGYYDAFLPHTPALRIVPLFEACLADVLPAEPHDTPVHLLVTERRTVVISPRGLRTGS